MSLAPASPEFLTALAATLPEGTLRAPTPAHLEEPRGRFPGKAAALLVPQTTEEVATIVRACAAARVGIVPYAGGTGLVGGQTSQQDPAPVLLSVERMTRIRALDMADNLLIAEAGVILTDLRKAAADAGRLFPLSLASEGSCRIGGNLATNAGGSNVLRYGMARDLCLGVEAVLPDGTIHHGLRRLYKDNTGYDLRHLLIGAEGTLGVITAACLKLYQPPAEVATALVSIASPAAGLTLLAALRASLGEMISAFELMNTQGFAFLSEKMPDELQIFGTPPEWSLLIEVGGPVGVAQTGLEDALAQAYAGALVANAMLAQSTTQARAFWRLREAMPEANRLIGAVVSHDISVPVAMIPDFIAKAGPAVAAIDQGLRINCFGHLGDGNLHYNVFPPAGRSSAEFAPRRDAIKNCVHAMVAEFGGSFSAEHGIGRAKTGDLAQYGDPAKLAAMRAIKAALDPKGIMNPGVIFG